MGLEFKVLELIDYTEGSFKAIDPRGDTIICYLHDIKRDWEKVKTSIGKTIVVRGSIMTTGYFMVLEICEQENTDMNKEYTILRIENRINLLEGRTKKENSKIINKLKRQLRKLVPETV